MARHGLDFLFVYAETSLSPLHTTALFPPLGQIHMAAFLIKQGYRCRIMDTRHAGFTLDFFADYLSETRPRWIGFTVLTDNFFQAQRLITAARKASPSSKIAIGGAHATLCDSNIHEELGADAVVHGEGEIPSLDLLSKKKLSDARGISFRRGKKIVRNPLPLPIDMDSLPPPDLSLVEGWEQMQYMPMVITGRGCPYRCTFCAAGYLSKNTRLRSVDRVIDDITAMRRQLGGNFISILDDTFTIDLRRTREFCTKIERIGGGRNLFWYAEGRVNRLARNPKLIREMRDAGLMYLQIGVESGDERVLKAYRKEIRTADAIKLTEICARERVFVHAGFIVGGPFESEATVAKTERLELELIEKGLGFAQTMTAYLNPFPGTDIFNRPEHYGLKLLDPRLLSSSSINNCVTETDTLNRCDIMRAHRRICSTSSDAVFDAVRAGGEELKAYLEDVQRKASFMHFSFLAAKGHGWISFNHMISENARVLAASRPQFSVKGGKHRLSLIPVRLSILTVDEKDLYRSEVLNRSTTPAESRVIHFCAGKLTGRGIARETKMGARATEAALASLEKKGLIIYRTF